MQICVNYSEAVYNSTELQIKKSFTPVASHPGVFFLSIHNFPIVEKKCKHICIQSKKKVYLNVDGSKKIS